MKPQIIGTDLKVLDHGFVKVIDTMGDDMAIVDAARVSYAGANTPASRDPEALIRYLMRNMHTSPFEMCEIKLCVKMPLFIARQWLRHRTANVNEWSGRYSIMLPEWYSPDVYRLQHKVNKQSSEGEATSDEVREVFNQVEANQEEAFHLYKRLIDMEVAGEMARGHLPLNTYTMFVWKIDLHNLFHFVRLRADSHAQYEIRVYAEAIENLISQWCPWAYQAYMDYQKNAVTLSALDLKGLTLVGQNTPVSRELLGMGKSEWLDFQRLAERLGHHVEVRGQD